jgi:hypothetical protein
MGIASSEHKSAFWIYGLVPSPKQCPTAAAPKPVLRQAQMKTGGGPSEPFFYGFLEESPRVYGHCFRLGIPIFNRKVEEIKKGK